MRRWKDSGGAAADAPPFPQRGKYSGFSSAQDDNGVVQRARRCTSRHPFVVKQSAMSGENSETPRPAADSSDSPRARALWGIFTLSATLWMHVLGICALAHKAMFVFYVSEDYERESQVSEREKYNFFFNSSTEGLIGAAQLEMLSLLWKVSFFVPWIYFLCRGCQASAYRGAAMAAFLCYAGSIGLAAYACISNIGEYELDTWHTVELLFVGVFIAVFSSFYPILSKENGKLMEADKQKWETTVIGFVVMVCLVYLFFIILFMGGFDRYI